MTTINYEGRTFKGTVNYDEGDFNQETRFRYHQQGNVVWADVIGGGVVLGSFLGKMDADGNLTTLWQYINREGQLKAGKGSSRLEVLPNGTYRLHESWQETEGGSRKGESVAEEIG